MANSEDYLDGLLDSITQAKTENESALSSEQRAREERIKRRTRLNPEDDFLSATGLDEFEPGTSSRRNLRHFLSESDYLKEFEADLDMMDDEADEYLKEFEDELSEDDAELAAELSDDPAGEFLGTINEKVSEAKESAVDDLENFSISAPIEEEEPEENIEEEPELEAEQKAEQEEDILSNVADILSDESDDLDLSVESPEEGVAEDSNIEEGDLEEIPMEEIPLDDIAAKDGIEEVPLESAEEFLQPEFAEDALDQEEIPEITEASVQEVPLMDESGEDVDLMDVLGSDGDLMDIGDLLSADENLEELDEAREQFENAAEEITAEGVDLESAAEEEEASSGGGIFGKILGIFGGLFKKGDDEDEDGTVEIGESSPTMEELAREDADILADFTDEQSEAEEDPKEKKKREKEEKKKQKQKEKEEKKKQKEAEKAAKPPKEKKQKPPKEPDNSPKIPLKGIIPVLILGISIIALVLISGNTIYENRTLKEAKSLYENGNYASCYTKLYGMEEKLDEEDLELMEKARILAKLELNLKEYNLAMEQEEYGEALDALVLGTYSYVRNQNAAESLNITDAFYALGNQIETNLSDQFGLSEQDAIDMFNITKRADYTKKIYEVLKSVNLE